MGEVEGPASQGAAVLGSAARRSPVDVFAAAAAVSIGAATATSHICLPPPLPLQEAAERGELSSRGAPAS